MSFKSKGTRYERELFHLFHNTGDFIAVRAAGSGSTTIPAPDLIVGGKNRSLAIECKAIKNPYYHFAEFKIKELLEFSNIFGAEPWLAIRFNNKGWHFIKPEDLKVSPKGYSINLELAEKKGIKFDQLTNQ